MSVSLGKTIDKLYSKDKEIDAQEAVLRELKRERLVIETKLLKQFGKEKLQGAKGARGVADVKQFKHPTMKDAPKFWKFVVKNKAFDLVQKRVSSKAYFDRLEAGEQVPGVEIFTRHKVNVKKRR
jgi:hypothetical protein